VKMCAQSPLRSRSPTTSLQLCCSTCRRSCTAPVQRHTSFRFAESPSKQGKLSPPPSSGDCRN